MDGNRNDKDLFFWLALLRGPELRHEVLQRLLNSFPSPAEAFSAGREMLREIGLSAGAVDYIEHPDWRGVESDLLWLEDRDNHLLTIIDQDYPPLLRHIPDPPVALFVKGDTTVLQGVQVAVVGTRKATADGRRLAQRFGYELAECGITVTSGLALGVDSGAHMGALDAGGLTVAVLGNGLDLIYPDSNRPLAGRIVAQGALVSELPVGYRPIAANFPRRNRIISGLSVGTLVVEAALRSGSLITARHALDQGRDVFAVPGSVRNIMARGCHALIRQGAKLVERVEDIIEEIGPLASFGEIASRVDDAREPDVKLLDVESKLLLDNIGFEPTDFDFLIETTQLSVQTATSLLSRMEITGLVERLPGGCYVRR